MKKISEQYCQYDKKGSLFNYYCSPFLFKAHKRKNIFFDNKGETNINENDLYIKCPFESCKDKWFIIIWKKSFLFNQITKW